MTPEVPKKIPAWIRNLRAQVNALNSSGLIKVPNANLQWDEIELILNPFEAFLMLNTASESLALRIYFGSVSDTSGIENIFEDLPFPQVEVMYNLEPVSKLWIFRELYVSDVTTKEEIYSFLKDSVLISVVGLQTLISRDKLVEPKEEILAEFGFDKNQRNWGNVSDSDKLLAGISY